MVTEVKPLQSEKALSPIVVTSPSKAIVPIPSEKVCDEIDTLNAFVCRPEEYVRVVSDNLDDAV